MINFEMSDIILLLLTVFIVIFVVFFLLMHFRQTRRTELLQEQLKELIFFSNFSERRADMEESVIALGKRFQNNSADFSDINHLPFRGQLLSEKSSNSFLSSLGLGQQDVKIKDKQIFVLTPFSEAETETFSVIRSTLMDAGFQVIRGDEKNRTDIFSDIVKDIIESKVVIANLNGRNPNVMYELGIAHMLDKPVILVAEFKDDINTIPFDLRAKNIVFYDDFRNLKEHLSTAVLQVIS